MGKKNWQEIAGTEEAEALYLLQHCERRGKVIPLLAVISDFIDQYKITPDADSPKHRPHLSGVESLLLTRFAEWRWGYKTCKLPLPCLSYWAKRLQRAEWYVSRAIHFLARQGLIRILDGWRNGKKLEFSIDALHKKVCEWIESQREEEKANDQEWQDFQGEEVAPEPEPEEEEESLPEPIAAFQPAPEWDMALAAIAREVGPAAKDNLEGIRAYWMDGKLIIRAKGRPQWNMLMNRFRRALNRHLEGYNWVMPCPARSA